MHDRLPQPRRKLVESIYQHHFAHQEEQCWQSHAGSQSIFSPPPAFLVAESDHAVSEQLEKEFGFQNVNDETFFSSASIAKDKLNENGDSWWAMHSDMDLPCTAEVQARLYRLQHPEGVACSDVRYLITKLKEGAHGIGSALTLVAHDLLAAIMVGRVLQVHTSSRWYFASPHCHPKHSGWDCFFLPVAKCKAQGSVEIVNHKRHALRSTSQVIMKKSFDIDGLSRNDIPSEELFFGEIRHSKCFAEYKNWVSDPANTFIQGTFKRGADPTLFYMLAQAMRYLMRAPQPWFRNMLRYHLPLVGISVDVVPNGNNNNNVAANTVSEQPLIYIQERGEIAKFREYYNVFGCHNINSSIFEDYVEKWCGRGNDGGGGVHCRVYISGNTPFKNYQYLSRSFESRGRYSILSTWKHPSVAQGAETERWGANSPASSWIDMFAGVSSTNWICIVQSNWCRVINFLRLTSGRARCGFLDGGALMISSPWDREKYCIVGPFPTKPFSNRIP